MDWDEPKAKSQTQPYGRRTARQTVQRRIGRPPETLEGEIARLKAELEQKKKHEAAASELFTGKS